MESMGIPISSLGLELTIATPTSGNGFHNSSPFGSGDGYKGSNIENMRELALQDMTDLPAMTSSGAEVDAQITNNMEKEAEEDTQVVNDGPTSQRRKCRWFSKAQTGLLEESFQQNNYPDKGTKQALADTIKMTLKQVHSWFVNRRSRSSKKKKVEENKELYSYKRQVESLTNKNQHLQRKLQKLKKKLNKLKLKQTPPPMALPLPPPPVTAATTATEQQQQQQNQVMYVPVLAGVFTNHEQNVATKEVTTTSFHTPQQGGNASAITSLPITTTGLLLPPPCGGSNI